MPRLAGAPQRGLMLWRGRAGQGEEHRLFFNHGKDLHALNASDGSVVESFGEGGVVDMTPKDDAGEPLPGPIFVSVPGVVFEDLLILGFSTSEDSRSHRGSVRAFSAVDGSLVWQFDTLPKPGDPGSETWAEGSLEHAGGANVWTGMALDEERGLLFAPTGSATPDFYGASRLGDNLFSDSLVTLDARTGELKWHFQVVRHDLWDKDNPSPPTLVEVERDGRTIDAVALTTKTGQLFLFERETGESLYEITELETPIPSTLPGEVTSPTQPESAVKISRQVFEVTDRTPEATAFVEEQIKGWELRPWAPPIVGTLLFYPWYDGGAEWGGSAFEPSSGSLIVNSNDAAAVLELTEVPVGFSDYGQYAQHCASCHGLQLEGTAVGPELANIRDRMEGEEVRRIIREGSGRMPAFADLDTAEFRAVLRYMYSPEPAQDEPTDEVSYVLGGYVYLKDHEGLPGNKPPWGTLNSIDLATGEINWKVPFGDYPSNAGAGMGAISYGGPVVTKSGLIFIAATPDAKLRAYDSGNGEMLWEGDLPAAGYSTPVVYSVDGRQFVVIGAGGGRTGGVSGAGYHAFGL